MVTTINDEYFNGEYYGDNQISITPLFPLHVLFERVFLWAAVFSS